MVGAMSQHTEPSTEMPSSLVFDEPLDPSEGPFDRLADWYRKSSTPEARAVRSDINAWHAAFPDRKGMLLGNLRGDSDIGIQQATDELYVHHLLAGTYEARYEEDASSPDFRLYQGQEYVAGIEVFTLFPDKDFASKESRNFAIVDEINRRVRPSQWYVGIDIVDWKRQPRVADVARWLEKTVASLPAPAANLAHDDYPAAVYSSAEVELAFQFLPRREQSPPTASEPIVALGPGISWWGQSARRLRNALSRKAGSRYDHRNRPFAVLIIIRDHSCDTYDVVNALYGDDAIVFRTGDPDSARSIRKDNGTFGRSRSAPSGKNRRLSCIFVLMRGWTPGSLKDPTVIRFDNPFAEQPFPSDVLTPTFRFVARHNDSGIRMEWEPSFPSQ
jgi:hypothetical protein